MTKFLSGKTALITGSTSGIGAAYATALAAAGARVMINGYGDLGSIQLQCKALRAASGTAALHSSADMTKADEIAAMVAYCTAELGSPDILINNAGIQHVAPIDTFPADMWRKMMAIMLDAPFFLMQACLPAMRERQWGRVISTTSAHASVASPNKSAYIAAKHGLLGLTRTAALEVAQAGITVNCISPGYVWTPLVENQIPDTMKTRRMTYDQVINDVLLASTPQKKFVMPEQVAALALFLCRDEASAITGANLPVDGGWTTQ
ncbi:MAG: 3-hydroxybutyrate dehydrogenase [Sphingomonadaceae bacterium]